MIYIYYLNYSAHYTVDYRWYNILRIRHRIVETGRALRGLH